MSPRSRNQEATPPASVTQPSAGIPSLHVNHSEFLANELRARMAQYDNGITAVKSEIEGMQSDYERDRAERVKRHESALSIEAKEHERIKGERVRLLADLERAKQATARALDDIERSAEPLRKPPDEL